jgi:hypothetical protein
MTDTPPLHVKATLRTRAGEFVCRATIPDFHPSAEVLVWGSRTFVRVPGSELEYREGMAFYVIQAVEMDNPKETR